MRTQVTQKKDPKLSQPKRAKVTTSADDDIIAEGATPREVAEYLASLLDGARELANKSGMIFLAHLIQVAVEEARIQAAAPKDSVY